MKIRRFRLKKYLFFWNTMKCNLLRCALAQGLPPICVLRSSSTSWILPKANALCTSMSSSSFQKLRSLQRKNAWNSFTEVRLGSPEIQPCCVGAFHTSDPAWYVSHSLTKQNAPKHFVEGQQPETATVNS